MDRHGVGALLVMSGEELVGIVTDRDIAVRCVGAGLPPTTKVREILTPDPVTIEGAADIFDAYQVLRDGGVRRLPVVEGGEIGGSVPVDDLLGGRGVGLGAVASPPAADAATSAASTAARASAADRSSGTTMVGRTTSSSSGSTGSERVSAITAVTSSEAST